MTDYSLIGKLLVAVKWWVPKWRGPCKIEPKYVPQSAELCHTFRNASITVLGLDRYCTFGLSHKKMWNSRSDSIHDGQTYAWSLQPHTHTSDSDYENPKLINLLPLQIPGTKKNIWPKSSIRVWRICVSDKNTGCLLCLTPISYHPNTDVLHHQP